MAALKRLLGLETFDITDAEIMSKIIEAKCNMIDTIEFKSGNKKVSINLAKVCMDGVMKYDYGHAFN